MPRYSIAVYMSTHRILIDILRCLLILFGLEQLKDRLRRRGDTIHFDNIAHESLLSAPWLDPKRFLLGPCYSQIQKVALHSHEQIHLSGFGLSGTESVLIGVNALDWSTSPGTRYF